VIPVDVQTVDAGTCTLWKDLLPQHTAIDVNNNSIPRR
jgi:hypothetical protein